ncbi:MAG: hypothetical protein ACEQSR_02725 [Candidatus Methylacidiphilales bacterium]
MKRWINILFVLLFSCNNVLHNDDNYENKQSNNKYSDCSVYQIIFKDGNYIFRFATSGSCKKLTHKDFCNDYQVFLEENDTIFKNRNGLINIEFNPIDSSNQLVNILMKITENNFDKSVVLLESDSESCIIKIGN